MTPKIILLLSILFSFILLSARAEACEDGHRVWANIDNGKVIQLENKSLWEIGVLDQTATANWRSGENITVCEYKLINTTENQSVTAFPLH